MAEPAPNTGYLLVCNKLLADGSMLDFLFDHFTLIADQTSDLDRINHKTRFIMQSKHFTEGYGEYVVTITIKPSGVMILKKVEKLNAKV